MSDNPMLEAAYEDRPGLIKPREGPPRAQVNAALAKAQANMTNPPRNREVKVKTKTGGQYTFRYSTLDTIIEHIRKPLTENGLWFVQRLESNGEGKYHLVTELIHASGQSIASKTPLLLEGTGNQQFGSALTYMRRYALCALLGIAADEDDDANTADGNIIKASVNIDPHMAEKSAAITKALVSRLHVQVGSFADEDELAGWLFDNDALFKRIEQERPVAWHGDPTSDVPGLSTVIEKRRSVLAAEALQRLNPLEAG